MFCRSLFVLLFFFLCCPFFFDIRILIAPLVSSNSSLSLLNIKTYILIRYVYASVNVIILSFQESVIKGDNYKVCTSHI